MITRIFQVALDDMLVQMENHLSQGRRSLGQMAMNQWIVAQLWSTNSASVIRAQIQMIGMMMICNKQGARYIIDKDIKDFW